MGIPQLAADIYVWLFPAVTSWSSWTACSSSMDLGTRTKQRSCVDIHSGNALVNVQHCLREFPGVTWFQEEERCGYSKYLTFLTQNDCRVFILNRYLLISGICLVWGLLGKIVSNRLDYHIRTWLPL